MLFLIEYDRARGSVVTFKSFEGSTRQFAEDTRFDLELNLNRRGINHEVVLLEAPTEEALRKTHRRYFENLAGLTILYNEYDLRET